MRLSPRPSTMVRVEGVLREFAGWLSCQAPAAGCVAELRRAHIEAYKLHLAARCAGRSQTPAHQQPGAAAGHPAGAGRRGTTCDPAWANRRRLLRGRERLSDQAYARMWAEILAQESTGELLAAWIAKEELRYLLALARTHAARSEISDRLFAS